MMLRTAFLLLTLGFQRAMCVEMQAALQMEGYKGTVTFARQSADVNVTLSFTDNTTAYDTVELYSLPAVFGRSKTAAQVCAGGIGTKIQDLIQGGTIATVTSLSESAYYHRSVLVSSSSDAGKPKLCATILANDDVVKTYRAKFMGPIVGSVWLRYHSSIGTFVYGDLATGDSSATVQRDLVMFSSGDVNDTLAFTERCSKLTGTKTILSASVNVQSSTLIDGTFGDLTSSFNSGNVRTNLAIVNGDTVVACATLRTIATKTVTSVMNWEEVKGHFTFAQSSPFDSTTVTIDLNGLTGRTGGYHVHKFPVAQRLDASTNPCGAAFVSGHFNPYNVDVNASPASSTGTEDQYEIGDLSGKYGTLSGLSQFTKEIEDWNLPLFGQNSVVGRSMVIHNSDGSRLLCSSIGYPTTVKTGISVFKSPTYGTMYFRQDAQNPDEDTSVFVELASQSKAESNNHNWHVHVYPVDDDAFNTAAPCASAGGHYNPSAMSVADPYKTECQVNGPFRCELGDLSGRLGGLNIVSTQRTEAGKFFFTDEYLPLSGAFSVLGRSIVVHGESAAAARYACANITQLHPVAVKTDSTWVGTSDGTASGTVTMEQDTEFDLTKVTGSFENLANLASGYHIHEYTISTSAASGSQCAADSVAGHYNPFGVTDFSIPATTGTFDQYEVGDLSNKYGLLDTQTSHTIPNNTMDTNLPLHTSLSAADRSIVIHKKEENARWKCANFMAEPASGSNGYIVPTTATFTDSKMTGTIKITQIVYEDGGAGLATYEVNISPTTGNNNSQQHDWHIDVRTVSDSGCGSSLETYDPYGSSDNTDYAADCKPENPLFCKVGDLSKKQARYDIGGGRKVFHDVDTPLHTSFTVLGRSISIMGPDGATTVSACANIIPDNYVYTLAFSRDTAFNRYNFTQTIADGLDIARLRVIVINNVDVPVTKGDCSRVMVHIAGGSSVSNYLIDSLIGGTMTGLGDYAASATCPNSKGLTVLGESNEKKINRRSNFRDRGQLSALKRAKIRAVMLILLMLL